jgi:hypothetical protein
VRRPALGRGRACTGSEEKGIEGSVEKGNNRGEEVCSIAMDERLKKQWAPH